MIDDEDVLFLRNRGNFNNFNVSLVVFLLGKDEFEDFSEVVLFPDLLYILNIFDVSLHLLDVGLFLLPQNVGFLGLADHNSN